MLLRLLSSCHEWGYSPVAVLGLLIVVASLVAEHRPEVFWALVAVDPRL